MGNLKESMFLQKH